MRRSLSPALLLAGAVLGMPTLRAQSPTYLMGAPYHNPSRAFIDLMIPHHETAVMMSEHAVRAAKTDAVKEMARKMITAQTKEIAELRETRRALFGSDSARSPMMRAMMQMMGMEHMRDTSAARAMMDSMHMRHHPAPAADQHGAQHGDFDRMFLQHMISHHVDGADMSVLAEDSQAAARVKQLAKKIREGQERDIGEMRRMLTTLPGGPPSSSGR